MKEITSRGVRSSQGMARWPSTCQTITKYYGGSWSNALENMGLMISKRGRARGSLKFSDEKYSQASVEFVPYCQQVDRTTTMIYYYRWVAHGRRSGRIWSSVAAQRQLWRTWDHVMGLGQKIVQSKTLSSQGGTHWVELRSLLSFVGSLAIDCCRLNFNPGKLP